MIKMKLQWFGGVAGKAGNQGRKSVHIKSEEQSYKRKDAKSREMRRTEGTWRNIKTFLPKGVGNIPQVTQVMSRHERPKGERTCKWLNNSLWRGRISMKGRK